MYDNIDFRLGVEAARGVDLLRDTPRYFNVTGEHYFDGGTVISGGLDGYKISVSERGVNIKDGSLCKYYLGDNFQTLGRGDTKRAIERLSDTLHLPISEAKVTRLDVAQNFIMNHPPTVYMNHLGELKYSKRAMCADSSLYYYQSKGLLIFYDKIREQKAKGNQIPTLYTDRNTLRYEQRYKKRLSQTFNVEAVTGGMLYDERFYIDVVTRWRESYTAIKKINDVSLNFEAMKGKKDLYTLGVLALAEMMGGELDLIDQINEAQQSGYLGKKQAFDIRQAVKDAFRHRQDIITSNEAINELSQKVTEATQFYR